MERALQALEDSISAGRPRLESLAHLEQVRASLLAGERFEPSSSAFRSAGDNARYQTSSGGITDPLFALEDALHKHYAGTYLAAESTGVSHFIAEVIAVPPEAGTSKPTAIVARSSAHAMGTAILPTGDAAAASSAFIPEEPVDRRDTETPFPYYRLTSAHHAHATLLERLYGLLRFGRGNTTAYLLDSMNGDTQAAVLTESEELGARCFPFASSLVKELPTRVEIRSTVTPCEESWEGDILSRKVKERSQRYPLLVSTGSRLPAIDPKVDFAIDRIIGILETLQGLLAGSVSCRSGCGIATPTQFIPPTSGRTCKPFVTSEFIEVSIAPWACCVSSYAMASACPITGGAPPRNWLLEARHGNSPWVTLRAHRHDEAIQNEKNFAVWNVDDGNRTVVANQFRIRRTGTDARNGTQLQVSSLELYGRLMCCWPSGMASASASSSGYASTAAASVPLTDMRVPLVVPLPVEPVPKNAKKKKK